MSQKMKDGEKLFLFERFQVVFQVGFEALIGDFAPFVFYKKRAKISLFHVSVYSLFTTP